MFWAADIIHADLSQLPNCPTFDAPQTDIVGGARDACKQVDGGALVLLVRSSIAVGFRAREGSQVRDRFYSHISHSMPYCR